MIGYRHEGFNAELAQHSLEIYRNRLTGSAVRHFVCTCSREQARTLGRTKYTRTVSTRVCRANACGGLNKHRPPTEKNVHFTFMRRQWQASTPYRRSPRIGAMTPRHIAKIQRRDPVASSGHHHPSAKRSATSERRCVHVSCCRFRRSSAANRILCRSDPVGSRR